jgi:hypothetical protein
MSTSVKAKVEELKARIEAIRLDPNLSDAGKEKAIQAAQKQLSDYRPVALSTLQAEANTIRRQYRDINKTRYPDALERAAKSWDYPRLLFEGERARAEIQAAQVNRSNPLEAIEAQYDQVMREGTPHERLAWSEVGRGVVRDQFGDRAASLIGRMSANAARLRETDEIRAIKDESGRLALRAAELQREVRDVSKEFDYEGQIALGKVLDGIHVGERIIPETLTLETSLAVDEEGAAGGS